jgi:hypothetical protein
MSVPRDPSSYHPSDHAVQQKRWRDISWEQVALTIESGSAHQTPQEDRVLFVQDFPDEEDPIGVIAIPDIGEIVTVEWRTKEVSHPKI